MVAALTLIAAGLVLGLGLFIAPDVFSAETADLPTFNPGYLDALVGNLFTLLASVLTVVATLVVRKFGLQKHEEFIDSMVLQGVALAEENAAQLIKMKTDHYLSGSEKREVALRFILGKIPELDRKEALDRVEAMLGRVYSAGASKNTAMELTK